MNGDLRLLKFFVYEHLPEFLQDISKPFADLAKTINKDWLAGKISDPDEAHEALRKLLEAKDCAVRSYLD